MLTTTKPAAALLGQAQSNNTQTIPARRDARIRKESGPATTLGLRVSFDKTEAVVAAAVTCTVAAERVGFHGYGMKLAEIGLPPGADVDPRVARPSRQGVWLAINQYDILPDKVVVYLWPQAGGVQFEFKFRPRFGLAAQTAPSLLYDTTTRKPAPSSRRPSSSSETSEGPCTGCPPRPPCLPIHNLRRTGTSIVDSAGQRAPHRLSRGLFRIRTLSRALDNVPNPE